MTDHPLRPVTDRCLGRPLPYQQANPTQAHPIVTGPKIPIFPPWGVCGISSGFPELSPATGQIPTRYSPVRHSSTASKLASLPFDLHVLSMPPAFNLSQDQTLQLKNACPEGQTDRNLSACAYRSRTGLRDSGELKRPHNLLD